MMRTSVHRGTLGTFPADAAVHHLFQDEAAFRQQVSKLRALVGNAAAPLDDDVFTGKAHQTLVLYPKGLRVRRIILVGCGNLAEFTLERLRRAAATAATLARSLHASSLAYVEPDPDLLARTPCGTGEHVWQNVGTGLIEGVLLGLYRFDRYRTPPPKTEDPQISRVILMTASSRRRNELAQGVSYGTVVADATCAARDLANAPGNEIYPVSLARHAVAMGRRHGLRVSVFDKRKIRRLGMGGLLGVSRGSEQPPRFIVMEVNRNSRRGTIVLVGKGVTFDSGGISIKPSAGMAEMKMDMAGAAAVLCSMVAAARLKIPLHLVGLIPAAENLPSGSALKPGDILRHANGKTSEVDNTDAEGRLILADALAYASRFAPDLVIDLATLTGACVVALGHHATGMLGNNDTLMAQLKEAGERTHERVWQLPLFDEYEKLIKSDVADVKNVGGRWAGAITGALFLKNFIGNYPWIHLDIAGTAMIEDAMEYIPKGASGVGVRLLVDFLRHWRKE